jgi:hypothetical protein
VLDQPSVSRALTKVATLSLLLRMRKKRKRACPMRTMASPSVPHRKAPQALGADQLVYVGEHGSLNEVDAIHLLTSILEWTKRRN